MRRAKGQSAFSICALIIFVSQCTMLMKYAFVLGRNPDLSVAELGSFFGEKCEVIKGGGVAKVAGPLPGKSPQEFLNRLGGCTEILEIFAESLSIGVFEKSLTDFLIKKLTGHDGKCLFAVSVVANAAQGQKENRSSKLLKHLLPKLKKTLRAAGINANFANNNFENVSPVFAVKNRLNSTGANVSIIEEGDGVVTLGSSVAMQDFEAYSKRDYGKPARDAQVGMLPPKLAQVMVNLGLNVTSVPNVTLSLSKGFIIDPFCGTGTILMEALLMGHSAFGSDLDVRMTQAAQKNLEWLGKSFNVAPGAQHKVTNKSAAELKKEDIGNLLTSKTQLAVVAEPHLGPPLTRFPADAFLAKVAAELSQLYLAFFKNLAKWLPTETPIVFIFPYWKKVGGQRFRLTEGLIAKILPLGYSESVFVPLKTTSLFYERPDQTVGREIMRFIKK